MSRRERRGQTVAAGAVALCAAWIAVLPNGATYAAWSDFATIPGSGGAGVWLTDGDPPLPDQCIGMVFDRIIIGTNKDDALNGTDANDLIFGLQGKDVLNGFAGQDCLVGGNGKDELNGEDGDDVLVGGNAKDKLTGGADDDICDGGRGKNTLIQCAAETSSTSTFLEPIAPTSESILVIKASEDETSSEPASDLAPAPVTGSGASVEDPPEAPLAEPTMVEPIIDLVVEQPEDVVPTETPSDDAASEMQPTEVQP